MYNSNLRKTMKKTLCAATLALLSIGSMSAKADFIKDAIEEGKLDVLKTLNNTDYSVNRNVQQSYAQLAKQMIEKRKSEQGGNGSAVLTSNAVSLATTAVAVVASMFAAYDEYYDVPTGKGWKSWPLFIITLTKLSDTANKLYNDSNKEDAKSKKAIETAEKIAEAVNELSVNENPRAVVNTENPRFVRGA